jgi:monoamine oxidase
MTRTPLLRTLLATLSKVHRADARGAGTVDTSRRRFLVGAAAGAALLAAAPRRARGAPKPPRVTDVGVVGAGLAGLVCATELQRAGVTPRLYEAAERVGGRCFSLGGAFAGPVSFPGQVVERGGELIDNLHKTMLGYAREFGLAKEDVNKAPGDVEVFYFFDGQRVPEAVIVDEYRAFVAAMRDDLRASSGEPTADASNDADRALDRMTLAEYLGTRGAGPRIAAAITSAYEAEYGLAAGEQSALNFLLFIHADRRSKFTPFGVFSDERWHLIGGNQQIPAALAARLSSPAQLGHRLLRVARTAGGRVELTFQVGARSKTVTHDVVVLTLPFSVLRTVELAATLALPDWKLRAIRELGYGTNAKMMVGFHGPYWLGAGCTGQSYSDLDNHQATWETNPSRASSAAAVLTDYASAARGARLDPGRVQVEAERFVADLDRVIPGAGAAVARDGGRIRAHLEHWPSNPLSRGSYTCYRPGQFTTLAGNEGKPVGNLFFAGEHTNSFYEWQGFMEGACLSGIDAAAAVLAG